jgi:PAS domain S-box-containing protein
MNAIPDLIIFNDPHGKLMGCNQAFEKLSGYLENDMLGFQASHYMPKALAHEITILNEAFDGKYPQQELMEAGEESYQGFCNQFTNEQGEILGTITILQDVTERQATQSALESAKNQAEYANQVKIQFLANMSHEIRTPINAMQGMMDLLTRTILDSRQQHYLANAQTAAFSLLHLIDELLDLSKIEAGKMVIIKDVIDLPSTIDKALKLNTANLYAKKLDMYVELAPNVPNLLMSDEMRLVQVLSNLLNNAIKFTDEGKISLLIDSIGLSATNALIRFKVIDTGIGIAKDKQGHLFEAFSQADISMTRKYGGSGLGLSICQQIVKLLGGEISLKSDLNAGCEFSFVLPFSLPSDDAKQNRALPMLSNNELEAIHICVINQELSLSCIETVESLSWHYHQFDDLFEFRQQFSTEELSTVKVAVLIDEKTFLKQKTNIEDADTNCHELFDLLALCQPAMCDLSRETCQQLDEMNAPYILLDTPLYRYSLDQIAKFLAQTPDEKEALEASEVADAVNKLPELVNGEAQYIDEDLANIKVLLVEDNLVNQLVAKELLMSMKAKVTIAENGQRALDSLSEHAFDIVLMDIQMPIMDGLTAAVEIRKQEKYQHLPIIAMTAHAREEDKQRSLAAGMNLHIAKPVTAKLLLASISQALALEKI